MVSVLLASYLGRLGFKALQIGAIVIPHTILSYQNAAGVRYNPLRHGEAGNTSRPLCCDGCRHQPSCATPTMNTPGRTSRNITSGAQVQPPSQAHSFADTIISPRET